MYPAPQRHNACLGPGVVPAGCLPLDAFPHAHAGPAVIQPSAGGPGFTVAPSAPNTHTQCAPSGQRC
jgi:hypothetical protein